jgi:ElaB/YqjD/DUF883 family membrane-anchored ribosome-binding protein
MNAMRDKAETVRDDIASTAETVAARAGQTAAEVGDKAAAASQAALREIDHLVATLTEKVRSLGVDTDRMADRARSTVSAVEQSIIREVSDRPLRALAIAGLIGLAIGAIGRK